MPDHFIVFDRDVMSRLTRGFTGLDDQGEFEFGGRLIQDVVVYPGIVRALVELDAVARCGILAGWLRTDKVVLVDVVDMTVTDFKSKGRVDKNAVIATVVDIAIQDPGIGAGLGPLKRSDSPDPANNFTIVDQGVADPTFYENDRGHVGPSDFEITNGDVADRV